MILIMPLIELSDGMGTLKIKCRPELDDYYCHISEDPLLLAKLWRKENAKCIHVVDKDSIERKNNFLNITATTYLADSLDIPIEFSGEFATIDDCRMLLSSGIHRIILGEIAFVDPKGAAELIKEFTPARVAFLCRIEHGVVFFPTTGRSYNISEFLNIVKSFGGNRIVYFDEFIIHNQKNYDYSNIERLGEQAQLKITLYEGINNSQELIKLKNLKTKYIDSAIIGRPLYENKFPCQQIWRNAEAERIDLFFQ